MYVAIPQVKVLRCFSGCLCLCLLLLPVTRAAFPMLLHSRSSRSQAELTGTYLGQAPAGDAARRAFTLDLALDGSATFNTEYIGRSNAAEHGRWRRTGDEVELTFDAMGAGQPPRPIIFRHRDHRLSPIHWDASEWGRSGPPVLRRSSKRADSASAATGPATF